MEAAQAVLNQLEHCFNIGAEPSGLRSTAEGGLALTAMWRCCTSCCYLRHHAPDKTGKLPCDSCFCNVASFAFAKDKMIVPAAKSLVGFIGIDDYCRRITFLSLLQGFWLVADLPPAITLGSFSKKHSEMPVAGFCNGKAVLVRPAGVFPWCQPQIGSKVLRVGKPFEVTDFNDDGQCSLGLDTNETSELFNICLVCLTWSKLLYPFNNQNYAISIILCKIISLLCLTSICMCVLALFQEFLSSSNLKYNFFIFIRNWRERSKLFPLQVISNLYKWLCYQANLPTRMR